MSGLAYFVRWSFVLGLLGDTMSREHTSQWQRILFIGILAVTIAAGNPWFAQERR